MEGNIDVTFGSFLPSEFAKNYSRDRNLFEVIKYTSSNTSDNNSSVQNENNNSGRKPEEGEASTSTSANRISLPNSGGEVSEFYFVEDVSISRTNSKTDTRENKNSNKESTVLNDTAIQTDLSQISVKERGRENLP